MAWESWVYIAPLYENEYTNQQLNSIVHTAQQDIKKDFPDQHQAWEDDGSLETRYTLDVKFHGELPTTLNHKNKLKHNNVVDYDFELNVHERLVVSHWDDDVEEFTVLIVIGDVEPIMGNKNIL